MNLKLLTILCVSARLFEISAENLNDLNQVEGNGSRSDEGRIGFKRHEFVLGNHVGSSQFPSGIFTKEELRHGAVILYLIGAVYSFAVIGIVCGGFFLPSVDCICTDLNLSQDVAAATFMSFATTAPELFIILIATFFTESDIGVGAVVGSGMFNILGVATIGGLAATSPIKLDWWPLYRDSLVYMFAPIALTVVLSDGMVTLVEAICLIVYYFVYFLIMFFNRSIRCRVKAWVKEIKEKNRNDLPGAFESTVKPPPNVPTISLTLDQTKDPPEAVKEDESEDVDDGSFKAYFMNYEDSHSLRRVSGCSNASTRSRRKSDRSINLKNPGQTSNVPSQTKLGDDLHFISSRLSDHSDKTKENGCVEDVEIPPNDDPVQVSLFTCPEGTLWNKLTWLFLWPSSFVLYHTIPDCRSSKWRRFYPITFLMCVFWIAVASYFGTWMISVAGETFGLSEAVMGLTFLAFGGSMPEAISTFIMSRQGEGGLGFSNSLGGNTMDICLCLGLPWFVKCLMGGPINIESNGLHYNCAALVVGIIVLLTIATHTRFHMNRKMGFVCCIFYFMFIVISILIEIEVIKVKNSR